MRGGVVLVTVCNNSEVCHYSSIVEVHLVCTYVAKSLIMHTFGCSSYKNNQCNKLSFMGCLRHKIKLGVSR